MRLLLKKMTVKGTNATTKMKLSMATKTMNIEVAKHFLSLGRNAYRGTLKNQLETRIRVRNTTHMVSTTSAEIQISKRKLYGATQEVS